MQIKLSEMSGKLKQIPAVNTNTLSNTFCSKMYNSKNPKCICTKCYSQNMLKTYRKNCVRAFEYNTKLLQTKLTYEQIPILNSQYLRINAHGELINKEHMINIVKICIINPLTTVVLYTKRMNLVNLVLNEIGKPDDLIIVYSNPIIDKPITQIPNNSMHKFTDKVFNTVSKDSDIVNCGARNCFNCQKCYHKNKDKIIYEQVK